MRLSRVVAAITASAVVVAQPVLVANWDSYVQYNGFERNGIEVFLNIPYGQDTGGANRFKPPKPFVPVPGTTYDATKAGPACPQSLGQWYPPLTLGNITAISEDCLNLNVARPKLNGTGRSLPVMVWIHGGSFWAGSNMEPTHMPDGLILESIANKMPIIHVALNYRLGIFGFAQSDALKKEGSENAGLRDQRLGIEWVRDNIAHFGGDPESITIFGQSSGGLSVGMQLMAYGGTKPLPFKKGIAESQVLEPGITGNFTINAMTNVVNYVGCNTTLVHAPEVIECLRNLDTATLFNASFNTYTGDISHNIGDIWLPSVDGDFLPAPPSQLALEGRFGNATYTMGWTEDDVNFFTDFSIATDNDTVNFLLDYLPATWVDSGRKWVGRLLELYPVSDFKAPPNTNLTVEFYRAARVFRDILMVCEPIFMAQAMKKKGLDVYLYTFNQTILEPIIQSLYNVSQIGVVHTSEFAYTYGNLSHWNVSGYPFDHKPEDYTLRRRASRSWSAFAYYLKSGPSIPDTGTFQNWLPTFDNMVANMWVFVIGGPREGLSAMDGFWSYEEIKKQRLRERCAFINDPAFIKVLQF